VFDRRLLAGIITSAVAGIVLSSFIHSNWSVPNIYSDITSFWGRSWVSGGQVPYSSSGAFLEYPPVSGAILYASRVLGGALSGVAGGDYTGYYLAFCAFSLLAIVAIAWSTWRLASDLGVRVNPLYFLLPTMIIYGIYNFDLFNTLFIILCLQLFVEKKKGLSAVTLGVALATKFVAVVLLPIFLLELVGTKERVRYLVLSLAVAAAFFVPIAIFNFGYFSQFYSFYSGWGLEDAWYVWIFGDPFSSLAKTFGLIVMGVLLLRVYTLKMPLVPRSFIALSAYLLGTYIYAPQFNVMLIPLMAVLAVTSPFVYLLDVFNALIILTWFTVPDSTHPWTLPQAMALLRSSSLALLSLSIASSSGHSLISWIRVRTGKQRWHQERLQGPDAPL
jgi:Gpi18-like mannosyltransferase